jgi:hypothetical protein
MSSGLLNETAVENSDWALTRARSGAAWLDTKFGPDWDSRINFGKLKIGHPIRCIVGQLIVHGYLSLMFAGKIVDHGFSLGALDIVVVLLPLGVFKRAYRPLTEAWKTVLFERRSERELLQATPSRFAISAGAEMRQTDFTQAA